MDEDLHSRIQDLVAEEHALRKHAGGDGLDDGEAKRLRSLEEALDRTWDLLRQRNAQRQAGLDPAVATERPTGVVEGYLS